VPKNALGRGLEDLLGGQQKPASRGLAPPDRTGNPVDLGPGLRVLAFRKNGIRPEKAPVSAPVTCGRTPAYVRVSLLGADLFVVTMTVLWVGRIAGSLQWGEALLCVGAILFAAWLGFLALWLQFREPQA
jgi:hypothetical protein